MILYANDQAAVIPAFGVAGVEPRRQYLAEIADITGGSFSPVLE